MFARRDEDSYKLIDNKLKYTLLIQPELRSKVTSGLQSHLAPLSSGYRVTTN